MTGFMSDLAHIQANNPCAVTVWNSHLFFLLNLVRLTLTVNNFSLNGVETFAPPGNLDGNDSTMLLKSSPYQS